MKSPIKISFLFILITCMLFISCREEDMELIEAPTEEVLVANSSVTSLIEKTSSNDGSSDNIIDKSNCFNIKFPVDVTVNGQLINVKSKEEYKVIEYLFDDDDDDIDTISITYPVTIVFDDYTEVIIYDNLELFNHSSNCNGENEFDDDIECLDFQYPITASIFNKSNEIIDTDTISTDYELNQLLKDLNDDLVVTLNFPINVTLLDDTLISINNLTELEDIINGHKDDCDEDDDFDHNDDDCDDCDIEALTNTLINCNGWTVDQLDRDYSNHDDVYEGYTFNFSSDGNINVYWSIYNASGTWVASGTKNSIKVTINIPDLPFCNNEWRLHEMSEHSKTRRVDFHVDDKDRLRYTNICN